MTLLARALAVLTIALSLALAAASAYASSVAKHDVADAAAVPVESPRAVHEPWQGIEPSVPGSSPALVEIELASPQRAPLAGLAASTPAPTPTVAFRYPAPENAPGVAPPVGGRGDLSPKRRVWRVPSIGPDQSLDAFTVDELDVPPDQLVVMKQVSKVSGVPWQVLAAIARVESDFGRNMATSSAGAIGYGQFLPEMWAVYGNGGDPYDYRDVIPAMARYLLVAGAQRDMPGAIYAYNHSWDYVALVLSVAATYGYPEETSAFGLAWPSVGPISTYFNPAHPGIDIDQTMRPGAPVSAAHPGIVTFAGGDPCCSYGRYVTLTGGSGIVTLYGHFDELYVEKGDWVRRGQPLGSIGCTGVCTGTHLHFEVIFDGERQNPLDFLP